MIVSFCIIVSSTRPCGARLNNANVGCLFYGFNPRAHVGRDSSAKCHRAPLLCFNPRAHVGRDDWRAQQGYERVVSIHAPTWGATALRWRVVLLSRFNPRAHGGRDNVKIVAKVKRSELQSTRPRGAQRAQTIDSSMESAFQSTRPRGARLQLMPTTLRAWSFNPCAHGGRD